uniref:Uncharacterized protein n=1 Tax=Anopheles minimus TaxID=112268 RepID=A0A182WNW9_9DIPT
MHGKSAKPPPLYLSPHPPSSTRVPPALLYVKGTANRYSETDQICGKATTRMETGLRSAMRYIRRIEEDRILSSRGKAGSWRDGGEECGVSAKVLLGKREEPLGTDGATHIGGVMADDNKEQDDPMEWNRQERYCNQARTLHYSH